MDPILETLPPVHDIPSRHLVLNAEHVNASVVHLAPGQEFEWASSMSGEVRLVFVVAGEVTIREDDLTHVLNEDQCLQLGSGRTALVANDGSRPAKLLRLDVFVPQPLPELVTMPRS